MKHATATSIFRAGALAAGASIVIAAPSFAQRYRGDNSNDNSRPAQRSEPRSEPRSAPREDRPIFRAPEPRQTMPSQPRWTPTPAPVPQRSAPVDNGPIFRSGRNDRVPDNGGIRPSYPAPRPDPIWRDVPGRTPVDNSPTPNPRRAPDRTQDNGGIRPTVPVQKPDPVWRAGPRSLPEPNRPRGGPGYRPGESPGAGSNAPGKPGGSTRSPQLGRRTPSTLPDGGTSPIGWRPPSRSSSTAIGGLVPRGTGGVRNTPGGPGSINGRPRGGTAHPVPIGNGYRPPRIDHSQWRNGRWYGGRHFYTIDLGWYDPWYTYNWGFFSGIRFYYPYYYCGPYISGFYYSPFWCYGNWAPLYIYPERVIYVERRVYLRDVVDDDYDLYDTSMQSSMRDTMDDIRSAWLDGDGGRLLDHINQSIPVRIYQKGVYKYSLEPDDFRDVSKDALNRIKTDSFEWTKVDKVSADEVRLVARHTFTDPDGERHAIRLSYTLEKARGGWWITETGTEKWTDDDI